VLILSGGTQFVENYSKLVSDFSSEQYFFSYASRPIFRVHGQSSCMCRFAFNAELPMNLGLFGKLHYEYH
jgi:hypothetical protein